MSDGGMDVVVAGFQDLASARQDFDVVCRLAKDKAISTEGVLLVSKDE
jgi:hypothetical protein